MPYIANTDEDRRHMFAAIQCRDAEEMWKKAGVLTPPPELKHFPQGMTEPELIELFQNFAEKNRLLKHCFLGGGFYDHVIPAVVPALVQRADFATAYTPYQAEASQGTLQSIFEYQTAICELTAMPVANASLYDGGTAVFEAVLMACRIRRNKNRVVISEAVSPLYRQIVRTSIAGHGIDIAEVAAEASSNLDDAERILAAVDENTAAVVVQYPNFLGGVNDWSNLVKELHARKILAVCVTYPVALGALTPPGKLGFDIVVGEGQSLGLPLNCGGPYLGFMAVQTEHMRKMPGRVVGKTVDKTGKEGYVLTLQTREQHIRREHAMSNICSNENLCALTALVYLCVVGKEGFRETARQCAAKAAYLSGLLAKLPGCHLIGSVFFNEFIIGLPVDAGLISEKLLAKGIAGGLPLGRFYSDRKNQLLIAVTEKRSREEMDEFYQVMEELL